MTLLWRQVGAATLPAPTQLPNYWSTIPTSTLPAQQWAYRTHVLCDTTVDNPNADVSRYDAGNWIRWAREAVDCDSPGEN